MQPEWINSFFETVKSLDRAEVESFGFTKTGERTLIFCRWVVSNGCLRGFLTLFQMAMIYLTQPDIGMFPLITFLAFLLLWLFLEGFRSLLTHHLLTTTGQELMLLRITYTLVIILQVARGQHRNAMSTAKAVKNIC
jgi:hypothetical protein